jgi:hypothetical protein
MRLCHANRKSWGLIESSPTVQRHLDWSWHPEMRNVSIAHSSVVEDEVGPKKQIVVATRQGLLKREFLLGVVYESIAEQRINP